MFVLAGGLALAWNALVLTATAEFAGLGRAGSALGFQQTGLAVCATATAPAFGALVAATSWPAAFAAVAAVAACAYPLLRALDRDSLAD